jgi:hypothetical protein
MVMSTDPAMMPPQSFSSGLKKDSSAIGRVWFSCAEMMNVRANRKSFQVMMNEKMLHATTPGATSGNSTRVTKVNPLAPSSQAASSSSRGTAATNPRSIQMASGIANARCTSISDPRWFRPRTGTVAPTLRIRKNSGIVSASTGTICATSTITSSVVRARNR